MFKITWRGVAPTALGPPLPHGILPQHSVGVQYISVGCKPYVNILHHPTSLKGANKINDHMQHIIRDNSWIIHGNSCLEQ